MRRELPREKNKVTCEVLRTRNNIYHRPCSTQYESAGQCNLAFSSSDNLYQPCVWDTGTNACKEAGQVLACDCALKHKNCPQHENGAAQTAEEDDGEGAIIAFALIIIVGGCAGVGWFFYKRNVATRDAAMDVAHADDDGPEDSPKKRKKKKGAMELDTDEL